MNDPLKMTDDLMKLIIKIKRLYKKTYFVLINIDKKKLEMIKNNLKIIDSLMISKNRNIIFCSNN